MSRGEEKAKRMSPEDEAELYRLTNMMAEVEAIVPPSSPLREAIQKAALALHRAFIQGSRQEIEETYAAIGAPLREENQTPNNLR